MGQMGRGVGSIPCLLRQFGFGTTNHTQRQNNKVFQSNASRPLSDSPWRGRAEVLYTEVQVEHVWVLYSGRDTGDRYLYSGPDLGPCTEEKVRALYRDPPLSLPVDRQTEWQTDTTENITFTTLGSVMNLLIPDEEPRVYFVHVSVGQQGEPSRGRCDDCVQLLYTTGGATQELHPHHCAFVCVCDVRARTEVTWYFI